MPFRGYYIAISGHIWTDMSFRGQYRSWGCCNTKTVQKVAATFWPGQNVVIAVQNVAAIFWQGQNVAVTFWPGQIIVAIFWPVQIIAATF